MVLPVVEKLILPYHHTVCEGIILYLTSADVNSILICNSACDIKSLWIHFNMISRWSYQWKESYIASLSVVQFLVVLVSGWWRLWSWSLDFSGNLPVYDHDSFFRNHDSSGIGLIWSFPWCWQKPYDHFHHRMSHMHGSTLSVITSASLHFDVASLHEYLIINGNIVHSWNTIFSVRNHMHHAHGNPCVLVQARMNCETLKMAISGLYRSFWFSQKVNVLPRVVDDEYFDQIEPDLAVYRKAPVLSGL